MEVVKRSKVRRNYLSYLRQRFGKSARLTGKAFDKSINDIDDESAKQQAAAEAKATAKAAAEAKADAKAKEQAELEAKAAEVTARHHDK